MTHQCPAPGCTQQVPTEMLACGPHWYSIPKALRDELWRTWRGPNVDEWRKARAACIEFLEKKAAA